MTARTTDIVGYAYRAGLYCPDCILRVFHDSPTGQPPISGMSLEQHLDVVARMRGIDRQDETSYDSGAFPKVVFRDMVTTENPRIEPDECDHEGSEPCSKCCPCDECSAMRSLGVDRCNACGKVLGG